MEPVFSEDFPRLALAKRAFASYMGYSREKSFAKANFSFIRFVLPVPSCRVLDMEYVSLRWDGCNILFHCWAIYFSKNHCEADVLVSFIDF